MMLAMSKPVLSISGTNLLYGRTNSFSGADLGLGRAGFEFASAVSDGAEIGRIKGSKSTRAPYDSMRSRMPTTL